MDVLRDIFGRGLPGVARVQKGKGFALGEIVTLPVAEDPRRGEMRRIEGTTGIADRFVGERKNAGDEHEWADIPTLVGAARGVIPVFNAMDYGAAASDVTINRAITAAVAAGHGIVYLDARDWTISASISLLNQSNVHIVGAGIGATRLVATAFNNHIISINGGSHCSVRDLEIDGDALLTGHAIRLNGTEHMVENVYIHDSKDYALGLGQQAGGTLQNCIFQNIIVRDAKNDCIDVKNRSDTNLTNIFNNIIIDGFDLDGAGSKAGLDLRGPVQVSNVEIRGGSNNGALLRFREDGANGLGAHDSSASNLLLIGNGASALKAVNVNGHRCHVSNATISGCPRGVSQVGDDDSFSDIYVSGATTTAFEVAGPRARLTNCQADTGPTGFAISANDATLVNCGIKDTTTDGVHVVGVDRAFLIGCKFTGTTGDAVDIDASSDDTQIVHCDFSQWSGTVLTDGGANTVRQGNLNLADSGVPASTIIVQEGDATVDAAVTTLDFDASDFNITSSPAGEANVALAYGTSAGTPTEGGTTVLKAGDTMTGLLTIDSANVQISRYAADVSPNGVLMSKSRNTTEGAHTIVNSGDEVGRLSFQGSDGTAFRNAARISAFIDGTPGASDMPGSLVFSTSPDGSSTVAEVLRLANDKLATFAGAVKITGNFGAFGTTPVAKATAYTQTYSTADKTHANPTATTLTAASGTADGTVSDAGAAYSQTTTNNNNQEFATRINQLIADVADVKQLVNSVIDDLQAYGFLS